MKKSRGTLVLVVGMPGSGKSTAAETAKRLGFGVFSFGDIVRDEVRRRKLRENEENVEKTANWFHSGREHLLAYRLEKKLRHIRTSKPYFIIEGARSPKQLSALKKHFEVKILAIVAPERVRWARQLKRHRSDIRNQADAKARDTRELSYGIEKLLSAADWPISSNCTINEFRKRCTRFFENIIN